MPLMARLLNMRRNQVVPSMNYGIYSLTRDTQIQAWHCINIRHLQIIFNPVTTRLGLSFINSNLKRIFL